MAAAGRAESLKPQADALVTVFTYDRTGVPWAVLARAERVATAAFAAVGVEVRWVKGQRLEAPRKVASGEALTVVFDLSAPAQATSHALARTLLGDRADGDVHVFYGRVTRFPDKVLMPEVLGNVLAHELTHALEGVKRHSREGLMKAEWNAGDIAGMVYGPLALAAEDLELLRAHFKREMSPAPALVAAR
jgi:hypothetical protein